MSGQTQPETALQALAEKLRTDAIAIFGDGQAERAAIEAAYASVADGGWDSVKHLGIQMFQAGAAWQRTQAAGVPEAKVTGAWESARIGDFNAGWNACRDSVVTLMKKAAYMELDTTKRSIAIQDELRALLAAAPAPVVPDGYVLVPVEPTAEMMMHESSCQHHAADDMSCPVRRTRRNIWARMLAAAPAHPAERKGEVQGGWIPVSERLPSVAQEVIVNSEFDGVTAGFLDSYGEWYSPNSDYKLTRVVAWQPLPAAPALPTSAEGGER